MSDKIREHIQNALTHLEDEEVPRTYNVAVAMTHLQAVLHKEVRSLIDDAPSSEWISVETVIGRLQEALKDPSYRLGWQANIAMAFKDEFSLNEQLPDEIGREYIHRIANGAASAFLEQLAPTREVPDAPGMMAVSLTHSIAQGGIGARSGSSERSEESGTPDAPGAEGMRPDETSTPPTR